MEKYDKIEGGLTYDFKEFKKKKGNHWKGEKCQVNNIKLSFTENESLCIERSHRGLSTKNFKKKNTSNEGSSLWLLEQGRWQGEWEKILKVFRRKE